MLGHTGKIRSVTFGVLLAMGSSGISVSGALANTDTLETKRQALFQRMLQQPDNLNLAFSYAALSVRVGDLEGAVSTLERMLIFSPGLARLQLELGILYYRLGNFDTSQSYFKAALSGENTSSVIRLRAEEYLELVEKRLKRFRVSTKSFFGLRWQSNANSGPADRSVILNGLPVTLGVNTKKKSGFGAVATSRIHMEYDLESQGDKLELDYVDYATLQFGQSRLNAIVSEVTFGPAFNLARFEIDDTFASVYAIVNGAMLNQKAYFGSLGIGTRLVTQPNRNMQIAFKGEYRRQWFDQTRQRPLAKDRNGNEFRGIGQIRYRFSPDLRGMFSTRVSRRDRRRDYYDYWEFGGYVQFDWNFDPNGMSKEKPWTLSTSAGYLRRDYDAPDPAVSATRKQNDDEYWVGGKLRVPLTKKWAIMPKAEYRQVNSNNPIRDYKAFTATIGVEYRR